MSSPNFNLNQRVIVTQDHNHIPADDTIYQIGSLDRIQGSIQAVLMQNGKVVGALPQTKLQAVK